jgi:hypothetical protein
MGLFDSTATKTSTGSTTFNTQKRRVNPDWVTGIAEGFGGEVSDLGKIDPTSLVPGADPLQNQASANATNLSGTPWNYDGALDLTRGVAQANAPRTGFVSSTQYLDDFMSPYTKDVVDAALADFDFGANQTRAQQKLELAGSGAFGGSGVSLTRAATEEGLNRGRSSTSANLRDQGFKTALAAAQAEAARAQSAKDLNAQLYGQQMDRTLGAAGQIADIAGAYGGQQRDNIATQATVGAINRDIAGQQANAVPDWLQRRIAMFGDIPLELFGGEDINGTTTETSTSKTKGSGSAIDKLGQGLQIAALFASDERLKTDVELVGVRPDGLGVYLYRYLWSPVKFIGVMAQEVLKVKPTAVVTLPSGFLAVDYAQL